MDGGVGAGDERRVRGEPRVRRRVPAARRAVLGAAALRAHARHKAHTLLVCTASSAVPRPPRRRFATDRTVQRSDVEEYSQSI